MRTSTKVPPLITDVIDGDGLSLDLVMVVMVVVGITHMSGNDPKQNTFKFKTISYLDTVKNLKLVWLLDGFNPSSCLLPTTNTK